MPSLPAVTTALADDDAASPTTVSTTPPSTTTSIGVAASVDLDGFLAELEMTHPEPFHGVSRDDFVAALEELKAGIDEMSPAVALVETMRLTALLSRQGRDGHQFAIPHDEAEGPILPFRIYEFDDGVFITAAHGDQASSEPAWWRSADHPIEEVLAAVEPLVPRDGPATVPSFRPFFTLRSHVLEGLGLHRAGARSRSPWSGTGRPRRVTVDPISVRNFRRGAAREASRSCRNRTASATAAQPGRTSGWRTSRAVSSTSATRR